MVKTLKIIGFIITGLFFILVITLFILERTHRDTIHQKTIEIINEHLQQQATFQELSISFLDRFPNLGVDIREIEIYDSSKTVLKIGEVKFHVNIPELRNDKIVLEKIVVNNAELDFQVDSLGNKPHLFHGDRKGNSSNEKLFALELGQVQINNSKLILGNYFKHNHTFLQISKGLIKPVISENEFLILGNVTGIIDSLVGNDKTLIRKQPIILNDALLSINRKTGELHSKKGEIMAHSLKFIPEINVQRVDSGSIINLRIDSEGTMSDFFEVVNLHFPTKLSQENPDAFLKIAFRQHGLITPFLKPHTDIDFECSDALIKEEDLPYPVEIELLSGTYSNGDKHSPESTLIRIDTLSAKIEDSFVHGNFSISNLKDPAISTHINGSIDLNHFIKETPKMKLQGKMNIDARYSGKVSELKEMHYSGYLTHVNFQNVLVELKSQNHIVNIPEASLTLKNHLLEVPEFKGTIDGSEFSIAAHVQNPLLHMVNKTEYLNAALRINCDRINLNTRDEAEKKVKKSGFAERLRAVIMSHVTTDINVKCNNLSILKHELKNIDLSAKQRSDSISFYLANLGIGEGTISGEGNFIFGKKGIKNVNVDVKGHLKNYDLAINREKSDNSKKRSLKLPESTHINLELLIDNAKLGPLDVRNFDLSSLVTNSKIDIRKLNMEYQGGKVNSKGSLAIDTSGFSGGNLDIGMDFRTLDANKIVAGFPKTEKPSEQNKIPDILKNLNAKINFAAKEFLYSDLRITDFTTSFYTAGNILHVDKLNGKLPFGEADLSLTINDYLSKDRKIKSSATLHIDSLDIEEVLAMKLLQTNKKTTEPEKKEFMLFDKVFSKNIDVKLNLEADQIQHKKKKVNNVDLILDFNDRIIDIKTLDFRFASGSTHLEGYLLNNGTKTYPVFVTSDIKNLNIQEILYSFDNFNQTVITTENTSGLFSWKSTHYLSFDPNLKININDNYWDFDFVIHDAELKDVEPLQNALFFIGHKAKSDMVIKDLNVSVSMIKGKIYFSEIIMNDNIANLEIIGSYSLTDSLLDVSSKISLTDLFFKSRKERTLETMEGIIPLEQDSKVFLQVKGNLAKHKINILSRKKMERFEKELRREVEKANKIFEQKTQQKAAI